MRTALAHAQDEVSSAHTGSGDDDLELPGMGAGPQQRSSGGGSGRGSSQPSMQGGLWQQGRGEWPQVSLPLPSMLLRIARVSL